MVGRHLFGIKALKQSWELIPLVTALSAACCGATAYIVYSLGTKSDVWVNRGSRIPPWEQINPEQPQKFLTFRTKYERIDELDQLRKEIGSYKC